MMKFDIIRKSRVIVLMIFDTLSASRFRNMAAAIDACFFSERTTLRSLYAISRPSVVCLLSVTLVHPTQAVELFGIFFHQTIAQGLYFSGAKNR